jgi:hypothetical protein
MTTLKDNSGRQILIAAIITILLQSGIVAGMAIHNYRISNVESKVEIINKNYIPTWFLEGMLENMNFQTSEIVATMNGDAKKIHDINEKYCAFQKTMLNNLIQMRGGISNTVRGKVQVVDTSIK